MYEREILNELRELRKELKKMRVFFIIDATKIKNREEFKKIKDTIQKLKGF